MIGYRFNFLFVLVNSYYPREVVYTVSIYYTLNRLFLSRVNTERPVQPTKTGRSIESEPERSNEGQQSGLALPFLERANGDNGQQGGE